MPDPNFHVVIMSPRGDRAKVRSSHRKRRQAIRAAGCAEHNLRIVGSRCFVAVYRGDRLLSTRALWRRIARAEQSAADAYVSVADRGVW